MNDDLTLTVTPALGGQSTSLTGWTSVRVTRGVDRCPSDFDIEATDRNPLDPSVLQVFPGDQCQVYLGADLVLTGYVDRVIPSFAENRHSLRIMGRSKCEDLVDCSACFNTWQISATDPVSLAQKLCSPFGIKVTTPGPLEYIEIPLFGVIMTETPMEIIERIARYAGLLAFDGRDGNLILTRAGAYSMASGFAQGQNVQEATTAFTMDQRYSDVRVLFQSVEFLDQMPTSEQTSDLIQNDTAAEAKDPGVLRYRPMALVAEQADLNFKVAQQRAAWEVSRRWGRSQQARVTCDSWRDATGQLWEVNALANVDIPALKLNGQTWAISEVSFIRDARGRRADVTMMPKEAFAVEPIILAPFAAPIAEAENYGAGPNGVGGVQPAATRLPTGGASK